MPKKLIYTDEMIGFIKSSRESLSWDATAKAFNEKFGVYKSRESLSFQLHQRGLLGTARVKFDYTDGMINFITLSRKHLSWKDTTAAFNEKFNVSLSQSTLNNEMSKRGLINGTIPKPSKPKTEAELVAVRPFSDCLKINVSFVNLALGQKHIEDSPG